MHSKTINKLQSIENFIDTIKIKINTLKNYNKLINKYNY